MNNLLTQDELDTIEARANVASSPPWTITRDRNPATGLPRWDVVACANDSEGIHSVAEPYDDENAEFIAHARQDIPALLAHIKEYEKHYRAYELREDRFPAAELTAEQLNAIRQFTIELNTSSRTYEAIAAAHLESLLGHIAAQREEATDE